MESQDPYQQVADEISAGIRDKALWVRSWSESGGDHSRATALYIRYRVELIRAATHEAKVAVQDEARWQSKQRRREATEKYLKGVVRSLLIGVALLGIIKCATFKPSPSAEYVPSVTLPEAPAIPAITRNAAPTPDAAANLPPETTLRTARLPSDTPSLTATPDRRAKIPAMTQESVTSFVEDFLLAREMENPNAEVSFFGPAIEIDSKIYTPEQLVSFAKSHRTPGLTRNIELLKPISYYPSTFGVSRCEVRFKVNETWRFKTGALKYARSSYTLVIEPTASYADQPVRRPFLITSIKVGHTD